MSLGLAVPGPDERHAEGRQRRHPAAVHRQHAGLPGAQLPTVSTGDAPQVAAITITFGTPGATAGSTGVQVTAPSLTGTGRSSPARWSAAPDGATVTVPAAALRRGAGRRRAQRRPARGTTGGLFPTGAGSGALRSGRRRRPAPAWATRPPPAQAPARAARRRRRHRPRRRDRGGTGPSSGLFTAGAGGSGSFDRTLPALVDQGGGPGAAVLAAPLGVLGLGAAALSAHAARTATRTPESDGGSVQDDGSTTA